MERNGRCFDEIWYPPDKINEVIDYVETAENDNWRMRVRVFVHMDNGDEYELVMNKLNGGKSYV
jgi:hypothetical protein